MSETFSSKSRDQDKDISLKTIEEWQMEVTPVYLSVDVLARLSVSGLEKKDFEKGNGKHDEDERGGGEEKEHDEDEEAKPRKGEKMVMARLVMTLMVVEEVEEEEEDDNRT